ncbi:MAG: diguanylate cyclase [Oscillospiraceae bacterium]|jgi:diguanylate cyclase (GGDEF)-like protein/PAS domain S-box-containing protein|nr:diguanylate cyclase [Oscillospiraceae bacterium]
MKLRAVITTWAVILAAVPVLFFSLITRMAGSGTVEKEYGVMLADVTLTQAVVFEDIARSYDRRVDFITLDAQLRAIAESSLAKNNVTEETEDTKTEADAETAEEVVNEVVGGTGSLDYLCKQDAVLTAVILYGADGKWIADGGELPGAALNSTLLRLKKNDFVLLYDTENTAVTKYQLRLAMKKAVPSGGTVVALFAVNELDSFFKRGVFGSGGRVALIDSAGNLLDNGKYIGSLEKTSMVEYRTFKEMTAEEQLFSSVEPFMYEGSGKALRMATLYDIGSTGWRIAAIADKAQIDAYSNGYISAVSGVCWLIAAIAAVFTIAAVLIFTKPLADIFTLIAQIKAGVDDIRLNPKSHDEIRVVSEKLNKLLDKSANSDLLFHSLTELSDNIIFSWDLEHDFVSFSNNFNKKFAYRAPSDRFEDSFLQKCKVHPDDAARYRADLYSLRIGKAVTNTEYRLKNMYGDYVWVEVNTSIAKLDEDDKPLFIVGVVFDIDRIKKNEAVLSARANFDALTGLYKRNTIEDFINNEIEFIGIRKSKFAIMFIDVDNFKHYNDNYSHATGDQVLQFIADTIKGVVSEYGIAGRYGGDEFVVCVRNSDTNAPATTAQTLISRLGEGFVCDVGDRLSVTVSIGIYVVANSSKRVDEIIAYADDAMYTVKKSGKSNFIFAHDPLVLDETAQPDSL